MCYVLADTMAAKSLFEKYLHTQKQADRQVDAQRASVRWKVKNTHSLERIRIRDRESRKIEVK